MTDAPGPTPFHSFKYISLATFRRSGQEVLTPNPRVQIAPCTARGKVTGTWCNASARILPPEEAPAARQPLARKYFLMRFPWLWSKKNIFLEITLAD